MMGTGRTSEDRSGFFRTAWAAALVVAGLLVSLPLAIPLLMGATFAALLLPVQQRLMTHRPRLSRPVASMLATFLLTLVFLIPAAFLVFVGVRAALDQLRGWRAAGGGVFGSEGGWSWEQGWIGGTEGPLATWLEKISRLLPIRPEEIRDTLAQLVEALGSRLAEAFGAFLGSVPSLTLGLIVAVISVYFFLAENERIGAFFRRASAFTPNETERLISAFRGLCRSVIVAVVASGIVQALIFTFGVWISGRGGAPLIAVLVLLTSFLPLVGSSPVTLGVTVHAWITMGPKVGFPLLIAALVTSIADNFVRPMVIKGSADLHPLIAFVAAFGGLSLLGFPGIFLGPILAGMAVEVLNLLFPAKKSTAGPSGPEKAAV